MFPAVLIAEDAAETSEEITRYEADEPSAVFGNRTDDDESVFPLLKHLVPPNRKGSLPRPYGISYVFHTQNQWYKIKAVQLSGVDVPSDVLKSVFVNSITYTNSIRADLWLFPFLNTFLYGGFTTGAANVYVKPPNLPSYFEGAFDINAFTIGPGVTLALGFGKFFLSSTFTYVFVFRPSADSSTSAALTTLFGYSFPVFNVWVGGMWQEAGRDQGGYMGSVRYDAQIETENPWNVIVGFRLSLIKQRLELMYQQGFGSRTSSTVNLTWRMGK